MPDAYDTDRITAINTSHFSFSAHLLRIFLADLGRDRDLRKTVLKLENKGKYNDEKRKNARKLMDRC